MINWGAYKVNTGIDTAPIEGGKSRDIREAGKAIRGVIDTVMSVKKSAAYDNGKAKFLDLVGGNEETQSTLDANETRIKEIDAQIADLERQLGAAGGGVAE